MEVFKTNSFSATEKQLKALDKEAKKLGVNRSFLMRELLAVGLEKYSARKILKKASGIATSKAKNFPK